MAKHEKSKGKRNKTEWTWPFPIEEAWNANHFIAKYAMPRIQALIEIERSGLPAGAPGVLGDKYGVERDHKLWLKYLGEMEYAFDVFSTDSFPFETSENKKRAKEGLHLFAEYYEHLWN